MSLLSNVMFVNCCICCIQKICLYKKRLLSRNNNHTSSDNNRIVKGDNDTLINSLNSEIAVLRSELASTNKIIEMMIKDNSNKYDMIYEKKT